MHIFSGKNVLPPQSSLSSYASVSSCPKFISTVSDLCTVPHNLTTQQTTLQESICSKR